MFSTIPVHIPLLLLLLLLLQGTPLITAKKAQYGNYTFTFFVAENCEGETNGEPMTGDVGELYCMNFTQGVYSARAEFTNLSDKHGNAIKGELFFPREFLLSLSERELGGHGLTVDTNVSETSFLHRSRTAISHSAGSSVRQSEE